jgi:hypothetical protein
VRSGLPFLIEQFTAFPECQTTFVTAAVQTVISCVAVSVGIGVGITPTIVIVSMYVIISIIIIITTTVTNTIIIVIHTSIISRSVDVIVTAGSHIGIKATVTTSATAAARRVVLSALHSTHTRTTRSSVVKIRRSLSHVLYG